MSLTLEQVERIFLEIEQRLSGFPSLLLARSQPPSLELSIQNTQSGGFDISIQWDEQVSEWTIAAGSDGAHTHENDSCNVVELIEYLLSDACRLRTIRGRFLQRTLIEIKENEKWSRVFETGYFKLRIIRKISEEIYQNRIFLKTSDNACE
jgi:hypothetical protein